MSKKDKDKDKRKKGEGREGGSAWIADLRRSPGTARPGPPASLAPDDELFEGRIPPLRPVSIETTPASLGDELSEETLADLAPIGPTEAHDAMEPESSPSPSARAPSIDEVAIPRPPPSVQQLEQQIRELEARLDDMISRGGHHAEAPPSGREASAEGPPTASTRDGAPTQVDPWRPTATVPAPAPAAPRAAGSGRQAPPVVVVQPQPEDEPLADGGSRATARDLLPHDFYLRQWGRAGRRKRAEEVDEFGHDPKYEARFQPFFDFLYKTYFRVEAEGTEHIPAEGRCLLVANHSGGPLPYDGIMLRTTVRREHNGGPSGPRELRWLAEDFVYYLPFVGTAMNRLGAVRACQENAERLLDAGHLVAVFPEGAKGIGKLFRERYRLQRFGRGGFIRLCLRTRTPLVPAAIIGAEEANPMLYRLEYMTKTLGIPYLPITPTFPALGPLGLLPAPTKWKVIFGEPVDFGAYGPEAADDELLVGRLSERVRVTIQAMLDRAIAGRQSIWFG